MVKTFSWTSSRCRKSPSRWQLEFVGGGGGWGKSRPVEIAELWEPWQSAEDEGGAKVEKRNGPLPRSALAKKNESQRTEWHRAESEPAANVRRCCLTSCQWFNSARRLCGLIHTEHFTVPSMQNITPGFGFQSHMTVFAMPVYVPEPPVIYAAAFAGEEHAEKKSMVPPAAYLWV